MRRYGDALRGVHTVQGSDRGSDLYIETVGSKGVCLGTSEFGSGSHGYTLGGTSAVSDAVANVSAGADATAGASAGVGAMTTVRSGGGGSLLRESSGSSETIDTTRADANLVKAITTGVLDGITRLGLTERHSEVLEAITNVTVQPPNLVALVDEITSVVTGAVSNVVVEPTDMGPIKQMMQELQGEIRAVGLELRRDFQSDLAVLQQELLANRKETRSDADVLLEELRLVRAGAGAQQDVQLTAAITTGVLDGIARLGLMERHSEVLEAITNVTVQPPDLMAVVDEITSLKGFVKGAVSNVVVEPIDIGPINQILQELRQDFQSDLAVLQQEMLGNRKETRSDTEVLLEELRQFPKHLTEVKNTLRAIERKDNADVLCAIGGIGFDEQAVANSVVDKLRRATLKVDQEDVLRAISRVSTGEVDPEHIARAVQERIIKVVPTMDDHVEVLNLVKKTKREPDFQPVLDTLSEELRGEIRAFGEALLEELHKFPEQLSEVKNTLRAVERKDNADILRAIGGIGLNEQAVATSVADKLRRTTLNVDQEDVLRAISRITPGEVDPENVARAVHERIINVVPTKDDHLEVVNLVKKIKREPDLQPVLDALISSEVDLTPVLNAIRGINVQVDLGPVLDAVRKIKVVDHEEIARSLDDRIRKNDFATRGDHEQVLQAVRQVKVDLRPVLEAIGRINLKVDHAPVLEAINGLEFRVDHTPVLEAVKRVGCIPTAEAIATLVHDRFRQMQFSAVRAEVDLSTVHASLNGLTDTNSEVCRALTDMRSDIYSLRCRLEVKMGDKPPQVVQPVIERVVQPLIQQAPIVQATAVVPTTTTPIVQATAVVPTTTTLVQTRASSPTKIVCPQCGNHYMDDSNFCRKCGKPRSSATPGQTLLQTRGSVKAPMSVTSGDVVQVVESYVVDASDVTRTPRARSLSRGTSPALMDRLQSASQELMQTRQSLADQRTASRSRLALSNPGLVLTQSRDGKLGSD